MTDLELAHAIERGEPPPAGFHHADHLRVAWVYLRESPSVDQALARMAGTLRRFAAAVGSPGKYSDAITAFWLYQVASALAMRPDASCDELLHAYPRLLDKDLIDAAPPGSPGSPRDAPDRALPGRVA